MDDGYSQLSKAWDCIHVLEGALQKVAELVGADDDSDVAIIVREALSEARKVVR